MLANAVVSSDTRHGWLVPAELLALSAQLSGNGVPLPVSIILNSILQFCVNQSNHVHYAANRAMPLASWRVAMEPTHTVRMRALITERNVRRTNAGATDATDRDATGC